MFLLFLNDKKNKSNKNTSIQYSLNLLHTIWKMEHDVKLPTGFKPGTI